MKPPRIRIPSELLDDIKLDVRPSLPKGAPSFTRAAFATYPDESDDMAVFTQFASLIKNLDGTEQENSYAIRYRNAVLEYRQHRSALLALLNTLKRV